MFRRQRPGPTMSRRRGRWHRVVVGTFVGLGFLGCDGGVTVRGEIRGISPSEPCGLELLLADTGTVVGRSEVAGVFREDFVVSPWRNEYRIVVSCRSGTVYTSEIISIGFGDGRPEEMLDLGVLEMVSSLRSSRRVLGEP